MKKLALSALAAAAFAAGCAQDGPVSPAAAPAAAGGQAGTTLTATVTAAGFRDRHVAYDWTVAKTASVDSVTVPSGGSAAVGYTLSATRTVDSDATTTGVRGQICVTNGGEAATEDLAVTAQVQSKNGPGQFQDLAGASQALSPGVLAPGETGCWGYEVPFTPVAGALYRVEAQVTITNHSGSLGTPTGPSPRADFAVPDEAALFETDETATLSDAFSVPAGLTVSADGGPWALAGSGDTPLEATFGNASAMCDSYDTVVNKASLVEDDTGRESSAQAEVQVYTGACPRTAALSIGYWKTHAGFNGNNADRVTQYLPLWLGTAAGAQSTQVPTASQAVWILQFRGDASNGINRMSAQLLGAKLNVANGASPAPVAAVIAAADAFLAGYAPSSWASLTKAQKNAVNAWQAVLEAYNTP
jgi:hypothetical protein